MVPIALRNAALASTLLTAVIAQSLAGQASAVEASERALVRQAISGTVVEIDYARPSVRGRDPIFGGQVPWGHVWTPGANRATVLRVSKDVTLQGVALPAGAYSLWLEVLESGPWTLVVHPDTLRSHGHHPEVHEGVIAVPVEPELTANSTETLSFDFQRVRGRGARIEFRWANTLVPIELGVDPGFVTTVAADVAAPVVGEWIWDDRMSPWFYSPEDIEQGLANAESPDWWKKRLEFERDRVRPYVARFEHDPERGTLTFVDPDAIAAGLRESLIMRVLVPRGEGMFMVVGIDADGEISSYDPRYSSLYEFSFDDRGRAVSVTYRNYRDEIVGTGTRATR